MITNTMIYIATIHWKTDRWIDLQLKYLTRFVQEEFRLFAFLNEVDEKHKIRFNYIINQPLTDHGLKLNILSDAIINESKNNEDIIIFLDGDAFPINDLVPYVKVKLGEYPLIALKRKENLGDVIAHPAFCATTIRFWKEIKGNWKKGLVYKNSYGQKVADVGGYLYHTLSQNNIKWYPLLRSNKINYHPLFFGVYDNIIYHHGAGFREPISSIDLYNENFYSPLNQFFHKLYLKISSPLSEKNIRRFNPYKWKRRKIANRNSPIEKEVFNMILKDDNFFEVFQ